MDNQDKLYKQFQDASEKAEMKEFPAMEKVWSRVEEKLDQKEDRKAIVLWKKVAIAASLLLFFVIGYQFFNSNEIIANPSVTPQNEEVVVTKTDTVKADKPTDITVHKPENAVTKSPKLPKSKANATVTEHITEKQEVAIQNLNNDQIASGDGVPATDPIAETDVIAEKRITYSVATIVNVPSSDKTIFGVIKDSEGLPLPGATVMIKGTNRTVEADIDGKYTIKAKEGEKLEIKYIGFETSNALVSGSNEIDIKLKESANTLEAVTINTGYKTFSKRDNPSAVAIMPANSMQARGNNATVKSEDIANDYNYYRGDVYSRNKIVADNKSGNTLTWTERSKQMDFNITSEITQKTEEKSETDQVDIADIEERANSSVIQNLQGQVAGLNISKGSGQPGADSTIILRGVGSINGSIEPLFIVDGVPVDEEGFRSINQNDIESINVLKDASATSIYGNRGGNGVIVITTKEGKFKNLSKRQLRKLIRQQEKAKKQNAGKDLLPTSNEPETQEDYSSFLENEFENPLNQPLSTFSIDVDNASYTNIRRFLNNGERVPKDAVRVEEMINFFKYEYPQPKDNHPFSINTEYSDCPWNTDHKLVRIGLQGLSIPESSLPASNLVFLIDVSGSMNETNKLPLLVESMKILVNQLRKKDKVAIVVYAGAAGMVLPPTSGDDKQAIFEALDKLSAGGSTAGGAGIELAYKLAQENFIKDGNNRVILATDGDFNVGSSSNQDMQTLIEEKRKSGVFLTCLGYGMGNYKDDKLQILSDKGNGNHAYIDNIQEANRFLGKEFKGSMFAIAKDVKIQIEFNPKHVQAYRLIGYETRKLRNEDFTNDAIDAGELGSGHTVTALYEVIPTGVKSDFFASQPELKYTKTTATGTNYNEELATVKFRYKKPDGDKSTEMVHVIENKGIPLKEASGDFKFCTAVAWFGLKLRDSKLVSDKSTKEIVKLAKQGLSNDVDGYRAEFIRLAETVK